MSLIGSLTNKVSTAVQTATQNVEQKTEQAVETLKSTPAVVADSFEHAPTLYDAGAHRPGRLTHDVTFTRGRSFDVEGQHGLAGVRGHAFTQRAATVVSAGADAFAGIKESQTKVKANGDSDSVAVKLGVEGSVSAFAGTVNGVKAHVQAGAEFTEKTVTREDLGDGRQLKHEHTVKGLWGGVAEAGAQVGSVTGANVDLFAGARGGGEARWAVVDGSQEAAGVGVRGMGMMGVGVKADFEAGYDVDRHQTRVSGGVGAALVVGGYAGGEVTVGGPDESPRREPELGRAVDFVRGRITG
ncbi:MAG: hypothetical protein U0228_06390 [Myxococcaceae bacterium]